MKKRRSLTQIDSKRWAAYATAGAAAAFGGASEVDADITVVFPGVEIRDSDDSDGFGEVVFTQTFGTPGASLAFGHYQGPASYPYGIAYVLADKAPGATFAMSIAGKLGGSFFNYPSNLMYGQAISALPDFIQGYNGGAQGFLAWGSGFSGSEFVNTGGYMAFKFDVGNGTQYGWAEVSLVDGAPTNVYQVERIAWADPGESLAVGQTGTAIPEPASLGALALGAVGLLAMRRRRRSVV